MKLTFLLSYLVLLAGILGSLVFIYWTFYPYVPVKFLDQEFPIKNKTVYQGQMVYYTSNYCKYMNLNATVTRTFQNDIIYLTPSTITNRPMGCNTLQVGVQVPRELPAGQYQLHQLYVFQVNPTRTVSIVENTEEFMVLEATQSAK
jgi:hypothetical protein